MTPATSRNPKNIRKQVGSAIWLLSLLVRFAPADWTGETCVYVAGSNALSDVQLAKYLEASLGTVARWRRRLRAQKVIGWLVAPGEGRVFWVAAVNRMFDPLGEPKPVEQKAAEGSGNAEPALRWIQ